MKLLLIYPAIECSDTNTSTYCLPLGLGSIATYCQQMMGDSLEIRILDGSMMTHAEQMAEVERFRPDATMISPTIGSMHHTYELAEFADSLGALNLLGGVHATNLFRQILTRRSFIHGVVSYDGEQAARLFLNRLVEHSVLGDECFKGIPNMAYRDSEGIVVNPDEIIIPSMDELSDIDYDNFDMKRFLDQTQKRGFGKAVSYYAGKGCAKRGAVNPKRVYGFEEYNELVRAMNTCTFCGRNELGLRNIDEDREARIVRDLHEQYGVTWFFNVQDTVNLNNTKPIGLPDDCWFRLFIGTESITPENIGKLQQRYGPNLIFQAGIEAASPEMRGVYGKAPTNIDDLAAKVEMMRDEGIQLHASFILGGRGETPKSMRQTTEVAQRLAEYDNVTWILMSPQLILPGSPDYNALLAMPMMYKRWGDEDLIDVVEINQDFLRMFAPNLTREMIVDEIRATFADISLRENLVLDVKGVVSEEEEHIQPHRPYSRR